MMTLKIDQRHDIILHEEAKTLEEMNERLRILTEAHNDVVNKSNGAYVSIEQQSKVQTKIILTQAAAASGSGGGGGSSKGDPPAQSVAITVVADTNIPFLSPVPVSYLVEAWFIDASGSPSEVWIDQVNDLFGTYFTVRASQIPGAGTLYYRVSRKA